MNTPLAFCLFLTKSKRLYGTCLFIAYKPATIPRVLHVILGRCQLRKHVTMNIQLSIRLRQTCRGQLLNDFDESILKRIGKLNIPIGFFCHFVVLTVILELVRLCP